MEKPLILVTNDDGITAPGIAALVEVAQKIGKVVVVAPDSPQSGMGHAITVNAPIRMNKSKVFGNIEAYTCSGTPVDCVKLAVYHIMDKKPDIIISGINHGANMSTNVLYSGTMSAAVEGALEGIPSIGFSLLDYSYEADFSAAQHYAEKIIKMRLKNDLDKHVCLNVNIPKIPLNDIKGIKYVRQARAWWDDKFDEREDPLGKKYYWLTGSFNDYDKGEDADITVLNNGYVSVVPTQFDMTAYHCLPDLNSWTKE